MRLLKVNTKETASLIEDTTKETLSVYNNNAKLF